MRRSKIIVDEEINSIQKEWCACFNITRNVQIVSSNEFLSPFCTGVFRPKIFLPDRLLKRGNKDLVETIIAHELAHIKRFDDIWIKLQSVLQILYFFHPVVWFANSRIHLARECICDSMVLSKNKISIDSYGNSLLKVLKLNLFGPENVGLLPCFGSQHDKFKIRIQAMKGAHVMKKHRFLLVSAVLFLFGLMVLPMSSSPLKSQDKKKVIVKPVIVQKVKPVTQESKSALLNLQQLDSTQVQKRIIVKPVVVENAKVQTQEVRPQRIVISKINPQVTVIAKQSEGMKLINPVKIEVITSPFGNTIHPVTGKENMHNGIDIGARLGDPVSAPADGTVLSVERDFTYESKWGKTLTLIHDNNIKTKYAHLDTILVNEGQKILAGDLIARVGNTGITTGPHLHFEVHENDVPVNPARYLVLSRTIVK